MNITLENCTNFYASKDWIAYRDRFIDSYQAAVAATNIYPEQVSDIDLLCKFAQYMWSALPDNRSIHYDSQIFNGLCDMAERYVFGE